MKDYPKIWQHKKTKKKVRVMPWWETVEGSAIRDKDIGVAEPGIPWKFGMLVQVGWLLENENNVWFGVGPTAKDSFKEVKK